MTVARDEGKRRETWRDWLAPGMPESPRLLTREEVAHELQEARVTPTVTVDDLRYWEQEGILPRPVRQRHQGATRAVYPDWFVPLVSYLRHLQSRQLSLKDIKRLLRPYVSIAAERGFTPNEMPLVHRPPMGPHPDIEFAEMVREFAPWVQRTFRTPPIGRAMLTFLDRNGQPIPFGESGTYLFLSVPIPDE